MLTYSLHWASETKRTCRIKEIMEVKRKKMWKGRRKCMKKCIATRRRKRRQIKM